MKQRDGDQPLPHKTNEVDIQTMVIDDIAKRRLVGIERYGTALQRFNGRSMLRDAYEEALDLATYLRGLMAEDEGGVTYIHVVEGEDGGFQVMDIDDNLLKIGTWYPRRDGRIALAIPVPSDAIEGKA